MQGKVWVFAGPAIVLLTILPGRIAQHAMAQSNRTAVPVFEPEPLWSQALPNKWVSGQVGGVAADSHDNVWVFHRPATIPDGEKAASLNPPQAECCIPAPSVLEFDTNGKLRQAWGGPGQGYEWPASEHGIFVDYKDNVWIGGSSPTSTSLTKRSDDMLLKFAAKGKFLLQLGSYDKSGGNKDTRSVMRAQLSGGVRNV